MFSALTVVLSDNVATVSSILHSIVQPPYLISNVQCVEFFYCILFYLSIISKRLDVGHCQLYNIYHALFAYENSFYDSPATNLNVVDGRNQETVNEQPEIVWSDSECEEIPTKKFKLNPSAGQLINPSKVPSRYLGNNI